MIRVNIEAAQCSGTHALHDQRLQEWGSPQCKYYGSVKYGDPSPLNQSKSRPKQLGVHRDLSGILTTNKQRMPIKRHLKLNFFECRPTVYTRPNS